MGKLCVLTADQQRYVDTSCIGGIGGVTFALLFLIAAAFLIHQGQLQAETKLKLAAEKRAADAEKECKNIKETESKLRLAAEKREADAKKAYETVKNLKETESKLKLAAEKRTTDASKEYEITIEKLKETAKALRREQDAKETLKKEVEHAGTHIELLKENLKRMRLENSGKGIGPMNWPMQKDLAAALKQMQYDPQYLHFAVCGAPGSGKSTLINALRGITRSHKMAAKVGFAETSMEVTRYPDPRSDHEGIYGQCLWYDIPGVCTLDVPPWQNFVEQGLFIFDLIVLVYDNRFTKSDIGIAENCFRFGIPVFVVKSKADQHVANMVKICREEGDLEVESGGQGEIGIAGKNKATDQKQEADQGKEVNGADGADGAEMLKACRAKYIQTTRGDFEMKVHELASKLRNSDSELALQVYIVSGFVLRKFVASAGARMAVEELKAEQDEAKEKERNVIDEEKLIKDMDKVVTAKDLTQKFFLARAARTCTEDYKRPPVTGGSTIALTPGDSQFFRMRQGESSKSK